MSNYIPNNDKKRKIRTRREQDLRRAIQRGVSGEKLIAAAERVRQVRIGLLKSRRANPPVEYCRHPGLYHKAGVKIQALIEMPIEAILVEFGVEAAKESLLPGARPEKGTSLISDEVGETDDGKQECGDENQ